MAEPLLTTLPALFQNLPQLFLLADAVFYVATVLFFGSIAVAGYRGYLGLLPRQGVRILLGLLAVMGGISLRGFFAPFGEGIYGLFNADLLVASLVSSLLLLGGMYLLTFRLLNAAAIERRIHQLEQRLQRAKKVPERLRGWRDPVKVGGALVLVGMVVVVVAGFREFPSMNERLLDTLGLTPEQFQNIANQLGDLEQRQGDLPPGCAPMLSILQTTGPDIGRLPRADAALAAVLEQGAGVAFDPVYQADHAGVTYAIGAASGQLCHATRTQFCGCFSTAGL
ncbi:MAG: hypothetical protein HY520_01965 [Candidatus Aenigmarchaeota archaeon]|nr:hypothetical protein [Candidatus Aenigmarchaeota archaeon]